MSATVIRRHVAEGLELAKRYRLGEPIRAAIAEHHGTTLIQYFYQKAKENEDDHGDSIHEKLPLFVTGSRKTIFSEGNHMLEPCAAS